MSSLKSALFVSGICVLAFNVTVGCTASSEDPFSFETPEDGGPGGVVPEGGNIPQDEGGKQDAGRDSGRDGGDSGSGDAGDASTDAKVSEAGSDGSTDASTDAGGDASLPPPGAPCSPIDSIQSQRCGFCGTQTRLCAPESAAPGAPLVWQAWGYCQNEVEDGCEPGSSTNEACGLCGNRDKVCQNNCRWAVGACKNEPPNACAPDSKDFQLGLSCAEGGRERVCRADCTYGPFGACFVVGDPKLTLSGTAGNRVSGEFKFVLTKTIARLSGDCPAADIETDITAYQYVLLENPTASTLLVTVGSAKSANPGSSNIDTVMAAYGATKPATDTARQACVKGVVDDCANDDSDFCVSTWATLGEDPDEETDTRVTVPPNGKVYVYVGAYSDDAEGDFRLIARTDRVN